MNASGNLGRIGSVQVGQIAPLGPDAVPSGFVKTGIAGPVAVDWLGLAGDAQADLSVHGGPEKAVYAYAGEHYVRWRAEWPALAPRLVPGGFGENLTTAGMDEESLCLGDVLRHGEAVLQLCQPRQPCFKLSLAMGEPRIVKALTRTGRSGWYFRVLRRGPLAAGDPITLEERPNPGWPLARFLRLIAAKAVDPAELRELAVLPGLASQWRKLAAERLREA